MRMEIEGNSVIACLEGRVSTDNAADVQKELERIVAEGEGRTLVIDAGSLDYISSAGLRVLLTIRKKLKYPLTVRNVSPEVYEVFDTTGFTTLLDVKKRLREISVEGCEVIGQGAYGTVYRVDPETIVKVYETPDCMPMIENEQKRAKQAFLKGVPTAISYDMVKVGDKYGSVFELLRASTYNDIIIQHPERWNEIIRQYVDLLHQIHEVEMERGELPEAKVAFLGYLRALKDILPEALYGRLQTLFEAMPEDLHMVHGDIQMKNVMTDGDQPLLIDMDTLSVGDPVFDLMSIHVAYVQFDEEDSFNSEEFFGISNEAAARIFDDTMRCYFEGIDEDALEEKKRRIILVALVRFLYLIAGLNIGEAKLRQKRIDRVLAQLEEMAWKVDALTVRD